MKKIFLLAMTLLSPFAQATLECTFSCTYLYEYFRDPIGPFYARDGRCQLESSRALNICQKGERFVLISCKPDYKPERPNALSEYYGHCYGSYVTSANFEFVVSNKNDAEKLRDQKCEEVRKNLNVQVEPSQVLCRTY